MYAPAKPDYPIATAADLPQYDGFLIGYVPKYSIQLPTPESRPHIVSALVMVPGQLNSRLSGIPPDNSGRAVPLRANSWVPSFRLLAQVVSHENGGNECHY